jgi:hypothetical protein
MLQTALALASKGLHVFPCEVAGKKPVTSHGCLDASTDPAIIRAWWGEQPNFNIGIATGTASRVFVVDIDGLDAEAALARMENSNTGLPPTVEALTGKGRHLYFKHPDIPINNSASKVAPGIDVRGTGGYVIAPPSLHPSGRRYTWSVDSAAAFADAPQWLLDKIAPPTGPAGKKSPADWLPLIEAGVGEGRRDVTLTSFAGYLFRHRVDPAIVRKVLHWANAECSPPLPDEDIDKIFLSIGTREEKRRSRD